MLKLMNKNRHDLKRYCRFVRFFFFPKWTIKVAGTALENLRKPSQLNFSMFVLILGKFQNLSLCLLNSLFLLDSSAVL